MSSESSKSSFVEREILMINRLSRGRVIGSLFEYNRLENNDATRTGGGEIAVNFASGSTVRCNTIKPNEQNAIVLADQAGGLMNQFDRQVYYPNGKKTTEKELIFRWGNQESKGLKVFQQTTKQELNAQVILGKNPN